MISRVIFLFWAALLTGCASLINPVVTMTPQELTAQTSEILCNGFASRGGSWQQKLAVKNELKHRELFTQDDWLHIETAKISMNMNSLTVVCAWGFPNDNNRSVGSWGTHEQWSYCPRDAWGNRPSYPCRDRTYVYIENGIVTGWQN